MDLHRRLMVHELLELQNEAALEVAPEVAAPEVAASVPMDCGTDDDDDDADDDKAEADGLDDKRGCV